MWHTTRLCAFDLETTGVDVEQDRIVTAAVIGLGGGAPTVQHEWIANPGIEIPAEATAVHHITTEYAREHGKSAHVVVDQIAEELVAQIVMGEATVVGHNVPYDLTLLDRECRRYEVPTLHDRLGHTPLHVLDTRVLDQYGLPFRKRPSKEQGPRQLVTLAQVYELPWVESEAHGCAYDALMSARIVYRIGTLAHMRRMDWPVRIKHHRKAQIHHLGGLSVAELHAAQIEWAAQQAAGLQEHFRKTDPNAVVDGAWPLRPLEAS
ncbi:MULTISPECIES: exonuclease domain-containing protein [unclassified Streptomyces]|uniref:exonuclease domain-containing protein n=1 Tax=unclassified Streptomyces TaxID=2593676 RepID=UPI0015CF1463|nr:MULTISPECIES: exonuclease domain-containing protein [unclassified Streptomyces]